VGLFWLALVGLKPWIRGDFLRAYTHHAVGYRHMYVLYTKQTDLTNPHIEPPIPTPTRQGTRDKEPGTTNEGGP
jgi:hypothetical protein